MNLPRFTADFAVYRTRNVYREFGQHAVAFSHASGSEAADALPMAPVCPVGGCPVKIVPCDPPECTGGESCCLVRTEFSGGFKVEYFACEDLKTSITNCGFCGHSCGTGEVCCNGTCVNTLAAGYNCTQCGCARGMTCQNGSCECPAGSTNCNGTCTNLASDLFNCGSCGNACPDLGNTLCVNGKCQCTVPGDIICNAACTNPFADSKNCGACGNACNQVDGFCCISAKCTFTDMQRDPNNCGLCGNRCPSGCCSFGSCADLFNDPANCGVCNKVCNSGCCVEGTCADLSNDSKNCGTCGKVCASGCCFQGKCADLVNDPNNCGSCGNVCANGCCVDSKCADFSTDPNNCGSCGNVCPGGSCCENGNCTTVPSLSSVSSNPSGNCNSSTSTNFYLAGANCENLSNLTVSLRVSPTQNLSSTDGFQLQLNAVPPPGNPNQINWMQYSFAVDLSVLPVGGSLNAEVEYWTLQGSSECIIFSNQKVKDCCSNANCCSCSLWDELFGSCCSTQMAFLPSPYTIPAGYVLTINLSTDPNSGNVTQANFSMRDNNNVQVASYAVPIPQNAQAPVQSFQVVAVGNAGCSTANFNPGGGELVYSVAFDDQLCVQGANIKCPGNNSFGGFTGESSNATYGLMSGCCDQTLSQTLTT